MKKNIIGMMLIITISHCANASSSNSGTTATTTTGVTSGKITLNITGVAQTNQKLSLYIYQNGILKGGLWSDKTIDGAGNASFVVKSVDANNCVTTTDANFPNGTYKYHLRVDQGGAAAETHPTVCGGTAGFLRNALRANDGSITVNGDTSLDFVTFSASGAQTINVTNSTANTVTAYCALVDSGVGVTAYDATFTNSGSSSLGQVTVTLNGAGATAAGVTGLSSTGTANEKLYCWADVNANNTPTNGGATDKQITQGGPLTGTINLTANWGFIP